MKRVFSMVLCLLMCLALIPETFAQERAIGIAPCEKLTASAPTIRSQPQPVTACVGTTAKFSVTASNVTSYQWQYRTSSQGSWSNSTMSGAKTETLSVVATVARNGYQYRCNVSNASGSVYTIAVQLTVTEKPVITAQPSSVTAYVGTKTPFTVTASGATGYQWQYRVSSSGSWKNSTASGAETKTLTVKADSYRNGYQYRCKVTNAKGSVYSTAATLTVSEKPVITEPPATVIATEGSKVPFTVTASGATGYQWQYRTSSSGSWKDSTISGARTNSITITAERFRSGYQYRCKVTNAKGSVYSIPATLTVVTQPEVTTQPESYAAGVGAEVKLNVKATGGALSYQWQYRTSSNGSWSNSGLTGYKTATLTVSATQARDGYQYRCKITNLKGTVYSKPATLDVFGWQCGSGVTWKLSGSGLLTISGNGSMFEWAQMPWARYVEKYDCVMEQCILRISVENGVKAIGDIAFYNCFNLTSATIPASVTSIGYAAFQNCSSLTSITVDSGNPAYCSQDGVLFNKNKTELIQFPAGKTGDYTIPRSVTTIAMAAFSRSRGVTSVTIPAATTVIGDYAFSESAALASITVDSSNPSYCSKNGVLFNKDKTKLIQCPAGKTGAYTIPSSVTTLGVYAFCECRHLTKITIPGSVTELGEGCFFKCSGLTGVTIPSSITVIGDDAFRECSSLTNVTLPDSVTFIGRDAFTECTSLTSFTIPSGVTTISDDLFWGCSGLKSVTIPQNVTRIGNYAFYECSGLTDVYYKGSKTQWSKIYIDENNEALLSATMHYNA